MSNSRQDKTRHGTTWQDIDIVIDIALALDIDIGIDIALALALDLDVDIDMTRQGKARQGKTRQGKTRLGNKIDKDIDKRQDKTVSYKEDKQKADRVLVYLSVGII
jgi:hypothetical protein